MERTFPLRGSQLVNELISLAGSLYRSLNLLQVSLKLKILSSTSVALQGNREFSVSWHVIETETTKLSARRHRRRWFGATQHHRHRRVSSLTCSFFFFFVIRFEPSISWRFVENISNQHLRDRFLLCILVHFISRLFSSLPVLGNTTF